MGVHLVFTGATGSGSEDCTLGLHCESKTQLIISIDEGNNIPVSIVLDRSSAIKLSKHLKSQIALMEVPK